MVTKRPHKNKGKGIRIIGFGSSFGYPKLALISKYEKWVENQIWFWNQNQPGLHCSSRTGKFEKNFVCEKKEWSSEG
jgi:hypothetical protein